MGRSSLESIDWFPILTWPYTCIDVVQSADDGIRYARVMNERNQQIKWLLFDKLRGYTAQHQQDNIFSDLQTKLTDDLAELFFDARSDFVPMGFLDSKRRGRS